MGHSNRKAREAECYSMLSSGHDMTMTLLGHLAVRLLETDLNKSGSIREVTKTHKALPHAED